MRTLTTRRSFFDVRDFATKAAYQGASFLQDSRETYRDLFTSDDLPEPPKPSEQEHLNQVLRQTLAINRALHSVAPLMERPDLAAKLIENQEKWLTKLSPLAADARTRPSLVGLTATPCLLVQAAQAASISKKTDVFIRGVKQGIQDEHDD
jgi:hypothetical protein